VVWERSPQLQARGDREPPVACLEPPAAVEISAQPDRRSIYLRYGGERYVTRIGVMEERMLARARDRHATYIVAAYVAGAAR
jgi:hypothetical protein